MLVVPADALASRMVPMNLMEMSAAAERIVVGVCTAREEGEQEVSPGASLRFTQYTFTITDILKSDPGRTLTIRQVRLGRRSVVSGPEQPIVREVLSLPDYQPGQELLLFLGADSALGLTSPVALEQAVFDVEMRDGRKVLMNRLGNRPLFRNMSASQLADTRGLSSEETPLFAIQDGEPIPYAPFVSLLRKLMSGN